MTAGEMWSVSALPCAARVARRCPLGHVYSLDGSAIHHPVLEHARVKWDGKISRFELEVVVAMHIPAKVHLPGYRGRTPSPIFSDTSKLLVNPHPTPLQSYSFSKASHRAKQRAT